MLELNLVNDINSYLERKGIHYSNELRMGIGIPDISLSLGANYKIKPIGDYYLLLILKFVEQKQIATFEDIKNEFFMSLAKVKQYVFALENMNLVKIKNQIVSLIKNIFSLKLGTVISIEAKLKDWKGACLQAERYLSFSDYSYVVMPDNYIKNVDSNLFKQAGIGLLSVSENKLTIVIQAKKSETCDFIQKYLIISKIVEKCDNIQKKHLRKNIFTGL